MEDKRGHLNVLPPLNLLLGEIFSDQREQGEDRESLCEQLLHQGDELRSCSTWLLTQSENVWYLRVPPSSDPIVNVLLATILQITLTTGMLNCSLTNVSFSSFSLLEANRWSTRLFASSWSNYINNYEQGFTWTDQITLAIMNKKSPELTLQISDQNQALWDSAK